MIWKLENTNLYNAKGAVKAKKCYVVNGNHHSYVPVFVFTAKSVPKAILDAPHSIHLYKIFHQLYLLHHHG